MAIHEKFVSAKQAAQMLGVTSARIGVLCRQGRFSGAEKIGSGWIIPKEAVLNHRRLPPGVKPRSFYDTQAMNDAIAKADNLKEKIHND